MLSRRPAGAGLLLTGALAGALAAAAAGTASAASAAPAALAGCTTTSGVTVVVDLTHWGRGITTACAPGAPSSGLAALRAVGVSVTGTQRYGTAFVCRLAGLPTAKEDACVDTPPASAYWAYFHASGGAWVSSALGAASYRPPVGSIEGWAFGSGGAPGVSPASVGAPPPTVPPTTPPPAPGTPAPTTTTRAPTGPAGTTPAGPRSTASSRTSAPAGAAPAQVPAATAGATTTGSPAGTAAPTTEAAVPTATDPGATPLPGGAGDPSEQPLTAEPAAQTSGGSPLPTLVAAGAVLALGGAGAVARRRRRRS